MRRLAVLLLFALNLSAQIYTQQPNTVGSGASAVGPSYTPQVQSPTKKGQLAVWPNMSVDSTGAMTLTNTIPPATNLNFQFPNVLTGYFGEAGGERRSQQTQQDYLTLKAYHFGLGHSADGIWSVDHTLHLQTFKYRSGISQGQVSEMKCYATGDCAAHYYYLDCHAALSTSSDEGCETQGNQLHFVAGGGGFVTASSSAATNALTFASTSGTGPGGGHYLVREAGATTYYIASTQLPGQGHVWSQYATLGPLPPATSGPAPPPVSTAKGSVTSVDSSAATSIPTTRNLVVSIDSSVGGGAGFTPGIACLSSGNVDTATVVSVQAPSGGNQSIIITSPKSLYTSFASPPEIWQGGPCGSGIVPLNGVALSDVFSSHNLTALPVVGSPSPGVLAIATPFTGGQQGPGYGYTKQDFTAGLDPGDQHPTISFSVIQTNPGIWQLDSPLDLTALQTPVPPSVNVTLNTNNPSWNGPIFHDAATTVPFARVAGQTIGTDLSSTRSFQFFSGSYSGTAVGSVVYSGLDTVAFVSMAQIASVESLQGNSTFPLTLQANTLPALSANETLDVANYWYEGGRGIRNTVFMDTSNRFIRSRQDIGWMEGQCQFMGPCLHLATGIDAAHPSDVGLSVQGYHSVGVGVEQATQAPGKSVPQTFWTYCRNGNCYNDQSGTTDYAYGGDTNVGPFGILVNRSTGGLNFMAAGGVVFSQVPRGYSNPLRTLLPAQNLPDGATIFPKPVYTAGVGFASPAYHTLLPVGIGVTDTTYDDQIGRIGVTPLQDGGTNHGGLFFGPWQAGNFQGNDASLFNGLSSGTPPPTTPNIITTPSHTTFTTTPSAAAVCTTQPDSKCPLYTKYRITTATADGESLEGTDLDISVHTQALGGNSTVTVSVPNYAQAPNVTGYGIYADSSTTTGVPFRRLGVVPIGGTVVDDGLVDVKNAGGLSTLPTQSVNRPVAGSQVIAYGKGFRFGLVPGIPTDLGLSRLGADALCVDGSAVGDCAGSIKAASVSGSAYSVGTTPGWSGTCTPPKSTVVSNGIVTGCQ